MFISYIDIKTKKISNNWYILNFIAGLGLQIFYFGWEWSVLIYPLSIIVVGIILFLAHIMGAGDSKYMASLFILVPYSRHLELFTAIVESTVAVGLIMLLFKIMKDFKNIKAYLVASYWRGLLNSIRSKFSYAPVMLLAWILWGMRNDFAF